jgi:hypothetical protein
MTPRTSHDDQVSFGQEIFSFGFSSLTFNAIGVPSLYNFIRIRTSRIFVPASQKSNVP